MRIPLGVTTEIGVAGTNTVTVATSRFFLRFATVTVAQYPQISPLDLASVIRHSSNDVASNAESVRALSRSD